MGCSPSVGHGNKTAYNKPKRHVTFGEEKNIVHTHRATNGHMKRKLRSAANRNAQRRDALSQAYYSTNGIGGPAKSGIRGEDEKFINEAIQMHNSYRVLHGVQPLCQSEKLTAHAQAWANEIARKDMLIHSKCMLGNGSYIGENIYMCWSSDGHLDTSAQDAVRSWYEEIYQYSFKRSLYSPKTGHFSQLIWKNTKTMGIAVAKSKEGSIYVVANYSPPGNITGKFEQNVLPLLNNIHNDTNDDAKSDVSDW